MESQSEKHWMASAPSNIALIKYMGKEETHLGDFNPTNASLSYTLDHLRTFVVAKQKNFNLKEDIWEPFSQMEWQSILSHHSIHLKNRDSYPGNLTKDFKSFVLREKGKERFLLFWKKLKSVFALKGFYVLSSQNNFPSDCGLASSASSFAALTQLAYLISKESGGKNYSPEELAQLSSKGSGSSCRSFFSGWTEWGAQGVQALRFKSYEKLDHLVVLVEDQIKEVSSSEAHRRVLSSFNFRGRPLRAEERLIFFKKALELGDWPSLYSTAWSEFWDMHSLFETSSEPFGYLTSQSLKVLEFIRAYWNRHHSGPLVTMDAGANVHLLFHQNQKKDLLEIKESLSTLLGFRVLGENDFIQF